MAMIQATCPSCGTVQEANDSNGFAFCTECGTRMEFAPAPEATDEPASPQTTFYDSDEAILSALADALKRDGHFATNLSDAEECAKQYDRWLSLIAKYKELIPTMGSDLSKEKAINQVIDFCDRVTKTKISYMTGEAAKDGKSVIKTYSPEKAKVSAVKDSKTFFISVFNNLPTRVELSKQLTDTLNLANGRVSTLKQNIKDTREKYKLSEKDYWTNNPEVANRKNDVKLSCLRILVVGGILVIIAIVFGCIKKNFLFFAAAALLLALSLFISRKASKKGIDKIKSEFFPESLKQLASLLDSYEKEYAQAEVQLRDAQEKMSAFNATRK